MSMCVLHLVHQRYILRSNEQKSNTLRRRVASLSSNTNGVHGVRTRHVSALTLLANLRFLTILWILILHMSTSCALCEDPQFSHCQ